MKKAYLALADSTLFEGISFGFEGGTDGEVVFNTGMTGYQEILTDPSYCQQIVILTYPMIGNYGVNLEDAESSRVQAAGLIVKEYCEHESNWRSTQNLSDYLKENKIVGVCGMPTREIVRHIREKGAMPGVLAVEPKNLSELVLRAKKLASMEGQNLIDSVTCAQSYEVLPIKGKAKKFIIAYDFGIKQNIVRELAQRGCRVKVVPAHTPAREVLRENPDGVVFSNGPSDPAACGALIENLLPLIAAKPVLGICLGHQLLALGLGAKTFKLKFGHRGVNQPVKDLESGRVLITSQNHGFAVSADSIPNELEITQLNLNDGTVEAFRHKKYPVFAIQYHPEANPGPHDARNVFDEFIQCLNERT